MQRCRRDLRPQENQNLKTGPLQLGVTKWKNKDFYFSFNLKIKMENTPKPQGVMSLKVEFQIWLDIYFKTKQNEA